MKASVLIVSKNRKEELRKTINYIAKFLDQNQHEMGIFLDGSTDGSVDLKKEFPWINWYGSSESIGPSRARSILYKKAKGEVLFGFDDDSHPLNSGFIEQTLELFETKKNLGIIAFREIKGSFKNRDDLQAILSEKKEDFKVKSFAGCGFAIRRQVYNDGRGFPVWIDIYGEESCVAMETLSLGYDILFTYAISVHHRVDKDVRAKSWANQHRFGKQIKNEGMFYLVYYPFPLVILKLSKLFFHNLKKYSFLDIIFFKEYLLAIFKIFKNFPSALFHRKPVSMRVIKKFNSLRNPEY
ncbi:glycosyltransferase family 2 protein [Salinimicrobium sp. TH3]|uniref:glycosyltransferase family 2 protein n=1 Tax=Salinimicrobium sp. TH3 TaxID=2997342 RepID=UPI0022747B9F|nr:glycosyltransferase [Salinimicrobium sp. TH3]MCY2687861.1 glycosyltransferase [Salinimicrobium sp. TH3]